MPTGTHSFAVGSVEDEAVLGDLARLGRPLHLQGLAGRGRAAQHGRAVQGHILSAHTHTSSVKANSEQLGIKKKKCKQKWKPKANFLFYLFYSIFFI